MVLLGVGIGLVDALYESGFYSAEEIASAAIEDLTQIRGIGEEKAVKLMEAAQVRAAENGAGAGDDRAAAPASEDDDDAAETVAEDEAAAPATEDDDAAAETVAEDEAAASDAEDENSRRDVKSCCSGEDIKGRRHGTNFR